MKKRIISALTAFFMITSSACVYAVDSQKDIFESVQVNTQFRFMWPKGYNIVKIRTEGCSINCLTTYVVKEGFLSEFNPDDGTDDIVNVYAYTEEGKVFSVKIKVTGKSEDSYSETICTDNTTRSESTVTTTVSCSGTYKEDISKCTTTNAAVSTSKIETDKNFSGQDSESGTKDSSDSSNSPTGSTAGGGNSSRGWRSDNSPGLVVPDYPDDPYDDGSAYSQGENANSSAEDDPGYDAGYVSFMSNEIENTGFIKSTEYLMGDIDLNGSVEVTDLTILSVLLMQKGSYKVNGLDNADVDGNNVVDIGDLATLKRIVSKDPTVKNSYRSVPDENDYMIERGK